MGRKLGNTTSPQPSPASGEGAQIQNLSIDSISVATIHERSEVISVFATRY